MLKELRVEHYEFACRQCATMWAEDYEVQHVEDLEGDSWEYYSKNGKPVTAPGAPGSVSCPGCGRSWINTHLAARRDVPLATTAPTDRPRRPTSPG